MSAQSVVLDRPHPRIAVPWVLLSYLLIGLVALVPRIWDLGGFVTLDEINFWLRRSEEFLKAIQSGDYAATALAPHPGVTTMWLGSAGIVLRRALLATGLLADESFPTRLALLRLPVVLVHVLGLLLGYRLLRRLLPAGAAALAAFLWAVDPFMIGYSRLLHVDALAGTFATLSLLAACLYWYRTPRLSALSLSGLCAGLAILSKSPALVLLPVVGLVALAAGRRPTADHRPPTTDHRRETPASGQLKTQNSKLRTTTSPAHPLTPSPLHPFIWSLLAWVAVAALTVLALWPALWVSPIHAFEQLRDGVEIEGAQPHMLGNFFLGQPVDAPGPLFYPAALALHLFPRTLLGLALLLWIWRSTPPRARRTLATLAGFVVLFIVVMSVFPKKFDRYLVPVFPAINILAAYGLARESARVARPIRRLGVRLGMSPRHIMQGRLLLLSGATLLTTAWLGDYSIDSFNPLLGGLTTGANTFLVGWGEGLEQAAAWLNQQPDITGVLIASTSTRPLQPYLRPGAQAVTPPGADLPAPAGYVVIYIRDVVRGPPGPPFDRYFERATPLYVVHIAGVEYAWIYQVAPPVPAPRPVDFGADIHLRGFEQLDLLRRATPMTIKLFWETRAAPTVDYTLFAHLLGPDGKRYAQTDLPYPTSRWGARRYITTDIRVELPAGAPPGPYRLVIGLYDPSSLLRLPLEAPEPLDPTLDGPDALVLTRLRSR
ncbi:MAG: glycosyltransferase family 39 protein [Roseiflexaceae bacterium]